MEVLAHISAKCSRQHDERYRKQASGYLTFEVHATTRSDVTGFAPRIPAEHGAAGLAAVGVVGHVQDILLGSSTYLEDTQQAAAILESQLLTSSIIVGSPEPADLPSPRSDDGPPPTQAAAPSRADTAGMATVLRSRLPSVAIATPLVASTGTLQEGVDVSSFKASDNSTWSDAIGCTELPSTYEVSDGTSGRTDSPLIARSGDSAHIPMAIPAAASTPPDDDKAKKDLTLSETMRRTEDSSQSEGGSESQSEGGSDVAVKPQQPGIKRSRSVGSSDNDISSIKRIKGKAPEILPVVTMETSDFAEVAVTAAIQSTTAMYGKNLMELQDVPETIKAPLPETSVQPVPPSFAEGILLTLKSHESLASRFKPRYAREINRFERGYWSFITPATYDDKYWTEKYARSMWTVLHRCITSGAAGWSIWCAKCLAGEENDLSQEVRVYCWGELVEHVYLLLYTATHSRVKRFEPVWRDAYGDAVVSLDHK